MKTLGSVVREARGKVGTLRQVAAAVGVSAASLSRLENDHANPFGADTLARIFNHLNVDRWQGFRLAGVIDPELAEVVRVPCRALYDLLRAGRAATAADWKAALGALEASMAARRERGEETSTP